MTKKKKRLIIFGAIFGTVYIVAMMFFVVSIPWTLMYLGGMSEELPEPKITYAEFPFTLVYSVDGNVITVNNTYVCEYEGIGWAAAGGSYRKWKGYVKETGLENVLICEDSKRKIFCVVGEPLYYMGEKERFERKGWKNKSLSPPHLYSDDKTDDYDLISVEEIKQTYNIEIISWEFSPPIQAVE